MDKTEKEKLRQEILEEIRRDPANTVFGLPITEVTRIIHEHRERNDRARRYLFEAHDQLSDIENEGE